jgi:N6-L-threonylcarbamoyladenine synthase
MESHQQRLAPLIAQALRKAKMQKPDLVAVTRGPGMRNNLQCGIDVAKGLSVAWNAPLIGVHHMQAHALAPRLTYSLTHSHNPDAEQKLSGDISPRFPFLSLLVSGGHTLLVYSQSLTEHRILASTTDIAIGDCLDKIARTVLPADILGTSDIVSYGSLLESFAFDRGYKDHERYAVDYDYQPPQTMGQEFQKGRKRNQYGWHFPAPLLTRDGKKFKAMEFSFAGINSHAERIVAYGSTHNTPRQNPMPRDEARALAKAAMESAFEHLASRVCLFLEAQKAPADSADMTSSGENMVTDLVVGGGVASNFYLKHILKNYLKARGFGKVKLRTVTPSLCTDNAAMIAWTAAEMVGVTTAGADFELDGQKLEANLSMRAIRKWSLENLLTPEKEEERERREEQEREERQRQRTAEKPAALITPKELPMTEPANSEVKSIFFTEPSDPIDNQRTVDALRVEDVMPTKKTSLVSETTIPASSADLERLLASFQADPTSIPIRTRQGT